MFKVIPLSFSSKWKYKQIPIIIFSFYWAGGRHKQFCTFFRLRCAIDESFMGDLIDCSVFFGSLILQIEKSISLKLLCNICALNY